MMVLTLRACNLGRYSGLQSSFTTEFLNADENVARA